MNNLDRVLHSLKWGLHAMFALLLAFGVASSAADATLSPLNLALAFSLAVLYAAWPRRGPLWIVLMTFVWAGLMFHGQDFMWLEFPLVFLYLRYLPRPVQVPAVSVLWAVAAFFPAWRYPQDWTLAHAIGPGIGTIFAWAMFFSYAALRQEAENYRDLADRLRTTQDDLARSENLAGRLEERERLSREIHDTVAQGLSSIVLMSRAAKNSNANSSREQIERLETIENVAEDSLEQARRFVSELAAPACVPDALNALVKSHRNQAAAVDAGRSFELVLAGDTAAAVPPEVAACLERAAREGLSNAAKHSRATRVVVTYGVFDSHVTLDVVDNGVGCTAGSANAQSFGLRGLRERVANAGGQMTLESGEAGPTAAAATQSPGTALTVTFNLEAQ